MNWVGHIFSPLWPTDWLSLNARKYTFDSDQLAHLRSLISLHWALAQDLRFLEADSEGPGQTVQTDLSLRSAYMSEGTYIYAKVGLHTRARLKVYANVRYCIARSSSRYKWVARGENEFSGICGQRRPRSTYASTVCSDGYRCSLTAYLFNVSRKTKTLLRLCKRAGWYELRHAKTSLQAYADSEGPDQPAHPRSLIRAFAVRKRMSRHSGSYQWRANARISFAHALNESEPVHCCACSKGPFCLAWPIWICAFNMCSITTLPSKHAT